MSYDFERVRKEFEERFKWLPAKLLFNGTHDTHETLLTFLEQATKEAYEQGWKDAEAQDDALLKRIGEIL